MIVRGCRSTRKHRLSSGLIRCQRTIWFRIDAFAAFWSEVTFSGLLRVDGPMKSNIRSADGTLVMTEHGHIKADIDVRIAVIDGYLEGKLNASHHVILDRNARVEGNIHTPSLTVRDGAVFKGCSFVKVRKDFAGCGNADAFETSYAPMLVGA